MTWPHAYEALAQESNGSVLGSGETVDPSAIFVRCHDCAGDGCDQCAGSGFDWSDTLDVRTTIEAATA